MKKMILETLLYEEEFRVEAEKQEAKDALFAFMKGEAKVNKVEDSNEESVQGAMDKNDFTHQGHSHTEEQPIISMTYQGKDFSLTSTIDKEYYYTTEDSTRDYPGHEEIKLKSINITNPNIIMYNEFGTEYVFTPSEIGTENVKHLEKVLLKYIK